MSFSLVDICPVGAFTSDIDKFTFRLVNSYSLVVLNLFEWSRAFVRFEVNSGIVRVTPIPLRNDRVVEDKSFYPILSDFSRLIIHDLLTAYTKTHFLRYLITDEPVFFNELDVLFKHFSFFNITLVSNLLSNFDCFFHDFILYNLDSSSISQSNTFTMHFSKVNSLYASIDQAFCLDFINVKLSMRQHNVGSLISSSYTLTNLSLLNQSGWFLNLVSCIGKWNIVFIDALVRQKVNQVSLLVILLLSINKLVVRYITSYSHFLFNVRLSIVHVPFFVQKERIIPIVFSYAFLNYSSLLLKSALHIHTYVTLASAQYSTKYKLWFYVICCPLLIIVSTFLFANMYIVFQFFGSIYFQYMNLLFREIGGSFLCYTENLCTLDV